MLCLRAFAGPCSGARRGGRRMYYRDRREETAVQQWAAPRVRTASLGVPIGRNPSVRAECACACAVLCDRLRLPQFETRFVALSRRQVGVYQDRREETAAQQWAAPRVRTAPWGVPFGRNPSVRAACACACAVLCNTLCLPPPRPCFGLALEAGAPMYQYLSGETAVRRAAAPRVRTAPRGVPNGRNPSAHTACACVCPMLCDPLHMLAACETRVFALPQEQAPECTNIDLRRPLCVALRRHGCAQPPGLAPGWNPSARAHSARQRASRYRRLRRGASPDTSWVYVVPQGTLPQARGQEPSSDR